MTDNYSSVYFSGLDQIESMNSATNSRITNLEYNIRNITDRFISENNNIKQKISEANLKNKDNFDFILWYIFTPWYKKLWWSLRKFNLNKIYNIWNKEKFTI